MHITRLAAVAAALGLSGAALAEQLILYAVDGATGVPSSLYALDPETGEAIQRIGPTGVAHITSLAIHPTTDVMYAIATETRDDGADGGGSSPDNGVLLTLNRTSGQATVIGETGAQIPDITFGADGTLYGWAERFMANGVPASDGGGGPGPGDDLVTIDLTTGEATRVGEAMQGTAGTGLSFDGSGRLLMKRRSDLFDVDPGTGLATFIRTLLVPLGGMSLANVLEVHPDTGLMYTALRLDPQSTVDGGGSRPFYQSRIFTFDPDDDSGTLTARSTTPIGYLSALAFGMGELPPAPKVGPLFAVDGASDTPSTLYVLNPQDGSLLSTVGPTGLRHMTSLGAHPQTGVLYGIANESTFTDGGDTDNGMLVVVNQLTGAATEIGATGAAIPDITFGPNGTLYGWAERFEDEPSLSDVLVVIDLATGEATRVGDSGVFTEKTGLAYDTNGRLFMKANNVLYVVNPVTGQAAEVTTLGTPLGFELDNILEYDPSSGNMYTGTRDVPMLGGSSNLFVFDPNDPLTTLTPLGSTPIDRLSAVAFGTSLSVIPTVGEWGLIVLGLLLLTAGTIVIRREMARGPAMS